MVPAGGDRHWHTVGHPVRALVSPAFVLGPQAFRMTFESWNVCEECLGFQNFFVEFEVENRFLKSESFHAH